MTRKIKRRYSINKAIWYTMYGEITIYNIRQYWIEDTKFVKFVIKSWMITNMEIPKPFVPTLRYWFEGDPRLSVWTMSLCPRTKYVCPPPSLSSSLVAPLCQCLVSCISVFLCRNSCNNILARGDKIQPPRYMHVPSSLVHLAQPYTTSLGTHNMLFRVYVKYTIPYLQDPKIIQWTTSTYHLDGIFLECCLDLYGVNPRMRNHHCLVQPLSTLRHVGHTISPKFLNVNLEKKKFVTIHASLIITTSNQNLFVTYLPPLGMKPLFVLGLGCPLHDQAKAKI